ncbi:MAG: FecR domain-containing protein [Methylophaga sp.]|nr:FecR domain-containing protein [Methylophaga sp.]
MKIRQCILVMMGLMMTIPVALADGIGIIKTLKGEAEILRDNKAVMAELGQTLYSDDEIRTGAESSLGILLHDDARISMGPDSFISLDQYRYDSDSRDGEADISIKHGTLSVIAGKMTEKTPGALKVKTPAAILAVRGTEFSVKVEPLQ